MSEKGINKLTACKLCILNGWRQRWEKVSENCILDIFAQLKPNFPLFYSSDVSFPYGGMNFPYGDVR